MLGGFFVLMKTGSWYLLKITEPDKNQAPSFPSK